MAARRGKCGDAAIYFDPWDVQSMKDAVLKLKNDLNLAESLAARGRLRLQTMFKSWDEIAADMMSLVVQLCP